MAKYTNEIHYNVTTDFKDNGLNKLNQEIIKIQDRLQNLKLDVKDTGSIDKITAKLDLFRDAINQSYNFRLNTTDLTKMNQLLAQSKVDVRELARDFASLGDQGRLAFMQITNELSKFNTQAKSVSAMTQKIWNTVGNTVRWGIISNGFQSVLDSVNRATGYVKELDRSLTDIRLVSNYSAQEMQRFAEQANKAAKALGSTTVAYTDASAIFVQQGMSLDNAEKMADLTIKVSNITGQTTSEVSEQITAWMNGYQLQAEELQRTLDSVVKVAAVSAADTEEIMTAASKVASTASTVGVSTDQLVAQMATIISTTREAPEAVGNAMKTIYSRLSSLKLGETLEDNVTLNSMTATLEKIGVQVLDDNNDLRDMGTIIEELQQKWVDLSDAQRMAASVQLAGRYQLNRFLALMNNQDYYKQMMSAAEGSGGFLDEKQAVYLESLEGHLNTLKASIEGIATVGLDTDDFNDFLEVLTDITDGIGTAVDAVGGFGPLIQSIGPILLKAFSSNIADSVTRFAGNIEQATIKVNNLKHANDLLKITNEEIFTTFEKSGGSASKLVNSLQQLSETRINASTNLSAEAQQRLNEAFEQGTSVLKQYIEVRQQQNLLEQKQANLDDVLINTNKSSTKLDVNTKEMRQRGYMDQSGRVTADGVKFLNDNLDITVQKGEKFGAVVKKIKKALVELDSQLKQTGKAGEEAGSGLEVAAEAARDLDKSVKLQNFIGSVTKAIGTMGQFAMGMQMLQTSIQNFNDETIEDPIERFNQGFIDLSFSIGMLLPLFSSGITKISEYVKAQKAASAAAEEFKAATEAATAAEAALNEAKLTGLIDGKFAKGNNIGKAGKEYKKAIAEATAAELAFNNAQKATLGAKIKDFFLGAAKGVADFGAKLGVTLGLTPGVGQAILAVGALAAAIGGLTAIYVNFFSEEAKNKKHQEEFTKKIQEQTAAYSEAKDNYNELMDTITNYQDAREALQTLTRGTEDWKEQTEKIRDLVNELIEKYPQLADSVQTLPDGSVYIPKTAIQEAQQATAKTAYDSGMNLAYTQAGERTEETDDKAYAQIKRTASNYAMELGLDFDEENGLGVGNIITAFMSSSTVEQYLRDHFKSLLTDEGHVRNENKAAFEAIPGLELGELSSRDGNPLFELKTSIDDLSTAQLLTSGQGQWLLRSMLLGVGPGEDLGLLDQFSTEISEARKSLLDSGTITEEQLLDLEHGKDITFISRTQLSDFVNAASTAGYLKYLPSDFIDLVNTRELEYSNFLQELSGSNIPTQGARDLEAKYFNFQDQTGSDLNHNEWLAFIDNIGGIEKYIQDESNIIALMNKGLSPENISKKLNISEWQITPEQVTKDLEAFGEKESTYFEELSHAILSGYEGIDDISEDQQDLIVRSVLLSQQAAQNLAEGFEENLKNLDSDNIQVAADAMAFFRENLANLLGVPISELTSEMVYQMLEEGLLNESLWSGDSEAIKQVRTQFLENITSLPENFDFSKLYDFVQTTDLDPEKLTEVLSGVFENMKIFGDDQEAVLRALGLQNVDGLFVPIETGIANVENALNDFAQALLNKNEDINEAQAQAIEERLQDRFDKYNLTDEQRAQLIEAAPLSTGLTSEKRIEEILDLVARGFDFGEAIEQVLENIDMEDWASSNEGTAKKAEELGVSFDELQTKAENIAEALGIDIVSARQKAVDDIVENQHRRDLQSDKVKRLQSYATQEDIDAAFDQFGTIGEIIDYVKWLEKNVGTEVGTASAQEYKESLKAVPWWASNKRQEEYIKEQGYDLEKYNEYYQELFEKYNDGIRSSEEVMQKAATMAEMRLQHEQYLNDLEQQKAEAIQNYLDQQQQEIDALEAGKSLAEQYQSEEGFSLTNDWGDTGKRQDFRKQFASMLGMTVEDSLKIFSDAELVEIANSKAFQEAMKGNTTYIGQLAQSLRDAGLESLDLETDIGTLFTTIGQKVEEIEEVVLRSLQDIITNFLQIVQNLNEGDTISEDEYNALVEQLGSEAVDKYFTTMADGTYMLIGAADEFKQNAMNTARVQIGEQLQQAISREKDSRIADYGDNSELAPSDIGGNYHSDDVKMFTEMEFSTAETLEQLQHFAEATEKMGVSSKIILDAYNENLVRLGMNYENATDEVKAFREAQASGNEENIAAAQRDLEGSIAIGEDQSLKELNLDPTEIDDYADHLQDLAAMEEDAYLGGEKLADSLEEDEDAAAMLSKQLSRMNRAVESLEKNWDDWADVLQNSSKGSKEYFDAMQSTRSAMSDLLDISEDFISADLVDSLANNAENMELMQRAAEGDGEAIDQLRQLALNDIIVKITEDNQLDPDFLSTQIAAIQEMLPDIEVGATVDDTALINALQEMIDQAGMTKDQVNALLGSMGFDANFETDQQPIESKVPIYKTTHRVQNQHQVSMGKNSDGVEQFANEWDEYQATEIAGYLPVEGTAAEFAMSTSAPGEGGGTPQLKSITRKASGSANNYSSSNRGGNGGGGKGSGGGGGGKGGGGSSKKNQADPIEKEKDRYQKVNEQIAKTVAEYDQLTEAQDRLLGPELAMNLEEQNEKLEEQIDLQKEKLRIQREEQRDRQKDLSQYGIQFNPDGTISNYSEVWDAQNAKLEAARQAYNGTDTEDEAAKEAWEAAQAYFDDFEQGITKYDSLLESIYDTNSKLQNLRNAIDDLSKSIVETAYDSLNSLQDLDDTMTEVRLNLSDPFGDDIWKQLESATDRLSDWFQMDEESANTAYNSLINQAQKLMDKTTDKAEKESLQRYIDNARSDLNSGSTGYFDMWNAQTNNLLKEYNDLMTTGSNKSGLSAGSLHELMDTAFGDGAKKLGSLVDQLQKARDLALDAMDEINDKFEDRKEQYEVINDELEHQLELSEMLHGDQAYAEQEKVLQAQLNNSKGQLGIAAEQVKLYEAWSKNTIEGTEEWKKANELLTDAQKDYNEQIEKAVELTQKLYENTINSQLDKWIQNALGNDMDWVQEEWELIQRNAEQYLDDVEKAYNIQKLQNSYEDLLNQSNQLDIQQQITDQMNQQLGYLRGKTQLSKYDVDYANAQLEILQRQIALEEARRNKNQMRLSRDAQGNYSYVYTANRDDVNSAESGLLDAQFNAYNLSKQNIIDSQSNALSALNDFYSSAQAIATNYNLSEEERAARLQSLWDYNREYLQGCAEQLGTSFENIQNDFYGMVDALEDINEGNLTEWTQRLKDGTMDMTMVMSEILSDAIFDWLTKFENFELDTYAVISQMLDSWNEYTAGLESMSTSAGESIDNITGATQQCVEQTNKLTESQAGFFDLLEKQAGTVDNYLTQMQGYADTIANLEGQMSQYKDNMEKLEKILRENYISYELNGELVDNSKKPSGGNGSNGKGGSGNGSGGKGSGAGGKTSNGTKFTNEELIEGVAGNIWTYGSWANDPTRAGDLAKKFGADMAVAIQQFVNRGMEALTHDWTTGYYRQFGIDAFATGGYTGSWDGGDGKLAILDSKELVLNAKDTENMLAAVNLVREVVRSMQGTTLSSGLSSLNGAFSSGASTVDQNVTITANFPNATSESEIKSAILGLVDQSVQYSARTKPTGKVF